MPLLTWWASLNDKKLPLIYITVQAHYNMDLGLITGLKEFTALSLLQEGLLLTRKQTSKNELENYNFWTPKRSAKFLFCIYFIFCCIFQTGGKILQSANLAQISQAYKIREV